jgi:hypothetical protein
MNTIRFGISKPTLHRQTEPLASEGHFGRRRKEPGEAFFGLRADVVQLGLDPIDLRHVEQTGLVGRGIRWRLEQDQHRKATL